MNQLISLSKNIFNPLHAIPDEESNIEIENIPFDYIISIAIFFEILANFILQVTFGFQLEELIHAVFMISFYLCFYKSNIFIEKFMLCKEFIISCVIVLISEFYTVNAETDPIVIVCKLIFTICSLIFLNRIFNMLENSNVKINKFNTLFCTIVFNIFVLSGSFKSKEYFLRELNQILMIQITYCVILRRSSMNELLETVLSIILIITNLAFCIFLSLAN